MIRILRHIYLSIFGFFCRPANGIHILNLHYITKKAFNIDDEKIFRSFLRKITKNCELISIQKAVKLIDDEKFISNKPLVALTFDDGFKECITIASILDEYDCKAAFFINSNYIDCSIEYQKLFNKRVGINTKKPMSWDQINKIHRNGHVIGSHGLDHLDFGKINNDEIDIQLKLNKTILEEKLNFSCDYFAWTYGSFKHFPKNALNLSLRYHKKIFSGTNSKNYFSFNKQVINRRHIEPFWPLSHINYFLSTKKK